MKATPTVSCSRTAFATGARSDDLTCRLALPLLLALRARVPGSVHERAKAKPTWRTMSAFVTNDGCSITLPPIARAACNRWRARRARRQDRAEPADERDARPPRTDHFDLRTGVRRSVVTWNREPFGEHLDVVRGLSYTGAGLTRRRAFRSTTSTRSTRAAATSERAQALQRRLQGAPRRDGRRRNRREHGARLRLAADRVPGNRSQLLR